MNRFRLALLVALPAVLIFSLGIFVGEEVVLFGMIVWIVFVIGIYLYADRVVLKVCDARQIMMYHNPRLIELTEEVSRRAGVPMPAVFVMPGDAPNVFSVGTHQRSTAIVFTEGLPRVLSEDEVRSAIAHELVHIYQHDTLASSCAATCASLLGMSAKRARAAAASTGFKGFSGIEGVTAALESLIIRSLLSPRRELRADEFGARLIGNPAAMANAIRTMEKKKHASPLPVPPAVAHVFMVNPLQHGPIAEMFAVHPSLVERVERLDKLNHLMINSVRYLPRSSAP